MRAEEKTRLTQATPAARQDIKEHIEWLNDVCAGWTST
jgi:hypothetical protein